MQVDTDLDGGTLSSTTPQNRSVGLIIHTATDIPGSLRINCDRCLVGIEEFYYHCLAPNGGNYDICMKCASKGIYCENDMHDWVKRLVKDGEGSDIGDVILPISTRTIQQPSRKTYPLKFDPPLPEDTPHGLFTSEHRYIRKIDPREILIFTHGEFVIKETNKAQAGWAIIHRPSAFDRIGKLTHAGTFSCRLENKGPTGQDYKQSRNRAALRAVVGALQFRDWSKDCNRGWRSVVIATHNEYVVAGAADLASWEPEGWKYFPPISPSGQGRRIIEVHNQDLWKLLLVEVRKLQKNGVNVSLWKIPRELNTRAERFSRQAAKLPEDPVFKIFEEDGPLNLQSGPFLSDQDICVAD